jgi:hypothetical protein
MRDLLGMQLVEIGAAFGGRDHSTVIHSLERVAAMMKEEPTVAQRVGKITRRWKPCGIEHDSAFFHDEASMSACGERRCLDNSVCPHALHSAGYSRTS